MKSLYGAIVISASIFVCMQRPTLTRLLTIRKRPAPSVRPLATARRRRS